MPTWKGIVGTNFTAAEFDHYMATVQFNAWRPQFVVLHNTAVPKLSEWHNVSGSARMQGLANFYQNQKKWSAGPHLFVADDFIWVFTPLNVSGVHSPSWNNIAWGVEMVGDYEVEAFDPSVRENVLSALTSMHATLGLDPNTLRLHKEDPLTTHNCPGKNIVKAGIISGIQQCLVARMPGEHQPGGAGLSS
jgi:hypothetical protein